MIKRISFLLALSLLLACFSSTAFAAGDTSNPPEYQSKPIEPTEPRTEFLFKDAFDAFISQREFEFVNVTFYNEVYYHYDENGEIDWALIEINNDFHNGAPTFSIVGNRVFSEWNSAQPFSTHNAVYDVKKNQYWDMYAFDRSYSWCKADEYDGVEEVYEQYGFNDGHICGLLGDLDKDNDITIADVTIMQRCLAGMWSFPDADMLWQRLGDWNPGVQAKDYFSDFNCDGERSIVDATAIQHYLAGLPFYRHPWVISVDNN